MKLVVEIFNVRYYDVRESVHRLVAASCLSNTKSPRKRVCHRGREGGHVSWVCSRSNLWTW